MRALVYTAGLVWFGACIGNGGSALDTGDEPPAMATCPGGLSLVPCPFETEDERAEAQAETERLAEIQDRHEDEVMAIDGVLSMGIGHDCDAEAFVFHVGYDEAGDCPDTVPAVLEGSPVQPLPMGEVVTL